MTDSEIVEYYTSEACAYFAIALSNLFGYSIGVLFDPYETEWYKSGDPVHVFCYDRTTDEYIDVRGKQTLEEMKKKMGIIDGMRSSRTESMDQKELRRRFMGNSDRKPLYGYLQNEVDKADDIIKQNMKKYAPSIREEKITTNSILTERARKDQVFMYNINESKIQDATYSRQELITRIEELEEQTVSHCSNRQARIYLIADHIESLLSKDQLTLIRYIVAESAEDIDKNNLGIHFVEHVEDDFFYTTGIVDSLKEDPDVNLYAVKVKVSSNNLDIDEIILNMWEFANEAEVSLKEDADIQIVSIKEEDISDLVGERGDGYERSLYRESKNRISCLLRESQDNDKHRNKMLKGAYSKFSKDRKRPKHDRFDEKPKVVSHRGGWNDIANIFDNSISSPNQHDRMKDEIEDWYESSRDGNIPHSEGLYEDDDFYVDVNESKSQFDIPKFLYHATYDSLLKKIKKEGLGGISAKKKWDDSKNGVVYLAYDPYVAESYAEESEMVKEDWLDEIVILKIDTDYLDKNRLYTDENVRNDDEISTLEYHGIIPWSCISFFQNEDTMNESKTDYPYFNKERKRRNMSHNYMDIFLYDRRQPSTVAGLSVTHTPEKAEEESEEGGTLVDLTEDTIDMFPNDRIHAKSLDEARSDYWEMYSDTRYATLMAIKKAKMNDRQPWKVVPFPKLQKCWEDFVKHGFVRHESVLDEIANIIVMNIIKVSVNTELTGHKQFQPKDDMEDLEITEEQLYESKYLLDDASGHYRISDYALDNLEKLAIDIIRERNAEKKLILVDRVLNTIHPRSDLAAWFVQGGSSSLNKLAGYENMENYYGLVELKDVFLK
jgi:hypothetical protein